LNSEHCYSNLKIDISILKKSYFNSENYIWTWKLLFQFWNIFFESKNQYLNSEHCYSNLKTDISILKNLNLKINIWTLSIVIQIWKLIFQYWKILFQFWKLYLTWKLLFHSETFSLNLKINIWIWSFKYEFLKLLVLFEQ